MTIVRASSAPFASVGTPSSLIPSASTRTCFDGSGPFNAFNGADSSGEPPGFAPAMGHSESAAGACAADADSSGPAGATSFEGIPIESRTAGPKLAPDVGAGPAEAAAEAAFDSDSSPAFPPAASAEFLAGAGAFAGADPTRDALAGSFETTVRT
eukprot:CAMPEP_0114537882 /NCGR_PEP_ID=MMETSP0109-20121206/29819_1 /TAXON_ID=29199 /ORGANISM="Chlorarachnion reptans, Strain CCCM449" /LENGTH=154 /DNA_ID=CAMNT_0001721809 /DNA_START=1630 /DNA_END=2091 /DNA_ORIENTATION=+